jgi:hypothetical protein
MSDTYGIVSGNSNDPSLPAVQLPSGIEQRRPQILISKSPMTDGAWSDLPEYGAEKKSASGDGAWGALPDHGAEPTTTDVAPVPKAVAPHTDNSQKMLIDFNNQQQAAGQRTSPIVSNQVLIGPAHQNDAGEIGYVGPSGEFTPTDKNKHVVLTDPEDNTPKVYARTEQTDEGIPSALGRLLGSGMGAGRMQVTKPVSSAITAAERIGVNLPKAIATDSPVTAFTGQVLARAPGGGPMVQAIEESRNALGSAVDRAATMAGGATDAAVTGENFKGAINNSFKPMVKSGVGAAYDNAGSLMNKRVLTPLANTQDAVASILARRGESAIGGLGKAVDTVAEAIKRPGGMTFDGIKGLRTNLGEMLDSGIFPEGMSQGELRQLYGALSSDLKASAIKSGGQRGLAAFERANDLNKKVEEWKDGLAKIVGSDTRSGEGISESILRMASTSASADIKTLAQARSAVPKEVWQDVASTAIKRLGVSRNGEWTPAAYATDFRQLSTRGRALLFSSVGSGDVLPFLNDIAEVSQKFVDRGKLANTSGTAGHNALYTAVGAIALSAANGNWKEPLAIIGAGVGANMLSRLLATKATAASVARWSRYYSAFAERQTPAARFGLETATKNLASTASSNGIQIDPARLMNTVQSPSGASADEKQQ